MHLKEHEHIDKLVELTLALIKKNIHKEVNNEHNTPSDNTTTQIHISNHLGSILPLHHYDKKK